MESGAVTSVTTSSAEERARHPPNTCHDDDQHQHLPGKYSHSFNSNRPNIVILEIFTPGKRFTHCVKNHWFSAKWLSLYRRIYTPDVYLILLVIVAFYQSDDIQIGRIIIEREGSETRSVNFPLCCLDQLEMGQHSMVSETIEC